MSTQPRECECTGERKIRTQAFSNASECGHRMPTGGWTLCTRCALTQGRCADCGGIPKKAGSGPPPTAA